MDQAQRHSVNCPRVCTWWVAVRAPYLPPTKKGNSLRKRKFLGVFWCVRGDSAVQRGTVVLTWFAAAALCTGEDSEVMFSTDVQGKSEGKACCCWTPAVEVRKLRHFIYKCIKLLNCHQKCGGLVILALVLHRLKLRFRKTASLCGGANRTKI